MALLERTKLYKGVWFRPCTEIAAKLGIFSASVKPGMGGSGVDGGGQDDSIACSAVEHHSGWERMNEP
jgi:hypothetical protein